MAKPSTAIIIKDFAALLGVNGRATSSGSAVSGGSVVPGSGSIAGTLLLGSRHAVAETAMERGGYAAAGLVMLVTGFASTPRLKNRQPGVLVSVLLIVAAAVGISVPLSRQYAQIVDSAAPLE